MRSVQVQNLQIFRNLQAVVLALAAMSAEMRLEIDIK
jgi:hypothetical protein